MVSFKFTKLQLKMAKFISTAEATRILGYKSHRSVQTLIEEGVFEVRQSPLSKRKLILRQDVINFRKNGGRKSCKKDS